MNTYRNPENPFVKNEYYYPDAIPYNQTASYWFNRISNISAFVIGLHLVGLLFFLIAFKTPGHFRPYSKMIFLVVFTNLIILISNFIFQVRLRILNGVIITVLTGPSSLLPYKYQCNLFALQVFSVVLAPSILPLQYFYRYQTIKNKQSPTTTQTLLYYCVPVGFAFTFATLWIGPYITSHEYFPDFDYAILWFQEKPIPQLIVGSLENPWTFVQMICLGIFLNGCYLLTVFLARRTVKKLNSQQHEVTDKSKELQKQVSRTLFIQALMPLLTSFLPLSIVVAEVVSGLSVGFTKEIVTIGIIWFPVLSCLSNIIFIVPYRRYCLNILPGYKNYSKPSLISHHSIVVAPQTLSTVTIKS